MRVVVGTSAVRDFTAAKLGEAVVRGWHAAAPGDDIEAFAVSDGVTGLAESLAVAREAPDAVIETGHLLTGSTSAPVGEELLAALDRGARRVVLGMGRSLVHDGGRGFAEVMRRRHGSLQTTRDRLTGIDIVVVGNERTPLVGLHGAGALLAVSLGDEDAQRLDREVSEFAAAVERELSHDLPTGRPVRLVTAEYSGLGGGSAFLALALGARSMSGVTLTAVASGLTAAITGADLCLVIVDEMDARALEDSTVAAIAPAALMAGCPVVVVTGADHTSRHQRAALGVVGCYVTGRALDPESLAILVQRVARTWSR